MKINTFILGDFFTNCYVVRSSDEARECLVIDPGFDAEPLIKFIEENSLAVKRVLLTHGHCDHLAGVKLVREKLGAVPVAISKVDAEMMTDDKKNLCWMTGMLLKLSDPEEVFEAGEVIEHDGVALKILSTPGHTVGGVSFYGEAEEVVFTGDALFAGGIGRTDFPGGDHKQLISSILEILFSLPDNTKVYSGHGEPTTIGQERQSNPWL